MRQSHSMNEHDLLNIYFMCNVSFRLKQKLERVAIGGCRDNFPFRYCTPATIFVSCVRKGVNFPLTVPILSDTACASLYLCNCQIRFPLLHGKGSEHSKNIYVKSKENHKMYSQVIIHILKGMYELTLKDRYEFLK